MKILVLTSSTGGGHDIRANALRKWAEPRGHVVKILRPLENGSRLYRAGTGLYNLIQKTLPALHGFYFSFLEKASMHRMPSLILGARKFSATVRSIEPDLVVSVHAHLNHGYFELVRRALPASPPAFVVYCGELADGPGFSRHWINPAVDLFAGPVEETCEAARKRGMAADKVFCAGLLLRPPFFHKPKPGEDAALLRDKWDLDANRPLLVLGTGANGVNRHFSVVLSTQSSAREAQIVALCGNNAKTLRWLENFGEHPRVRLRALPTLPAEELAPLLRSATFLYARPGAGTTSEAVACGVPMLFDVSRGIMPQEHNNLNFWEKRTGQLPLASSPQVVPMQIHEPPRPVPYSEEETPLRFLDKLEELVASR